MNPATNETAMEEEESLLLIVLPPEMIREIFEKIPHQEWASLFIVSKEFEKISKSVFVTKLVTKMLSSEWIGKTQWLTFRGNQIHQADTNFYGDRTGLCCISFFFAFG